MKILILGAEGMLGHKLFEVLSSSYPETYGAISGKVNDHIYKQISMFQTERIIPDVNAMEFEQIESIIKNVNPDIVINCLRVTTHNNTALSAIKNITVNSVLPQQLLKVTYNRGCRLIHYSSDCVFDGKLGMYSEDDIPNAIHMYGRTRLLGEVCADHALVLRGSVIGQELMNHNSLLDWFLRKKGGDIKGFSRAIYSGLSSIETAKVTSLILSNKQSLTGLYNIASDPISKYDLLNLAKKSFAVDVKIKRDNSFKIDRSLNPNKFNKEMNYIAPSWALMMKELATESNKYIKWE
jgi:dTDP-4-dehydrorhamnose reductase